LFFGFFGFSGFVDEISAGKIAVILSFVNIFLGFSAITAHNGFYYAWAVYLIGYFVVYFALSIKQCKKMRNWP
jgi:hypothetical protein